MADKPVALSEWLRYKAPRSSRSHHHLRPDVSIEKPPMKKILMLFLLVVAGALCTPQTHASGSYSGRPPQPPVSMDADKYNLGKQIFAGKAKLADTPGASAAEQTARLTELQGKLPKSAQKEARLPELGGKLSADQLKALEHFLEIRYKVK